MLRRWIVEPPSLPRIQNEAVPKLYRVGILRQTGRAGAETGAIETAARKLA